MNIQYLLDKTALKNIIPQQPPMLFIDGLIDCDIEKTRGRCGLLVGENFNVALNADLSLPTYALIEMMAQTAAATIYSTVVKNNQLPPVKGLLLSVRNFKNYRNSPIPKGKYLIANSTLEYSDENFKQVTANVVSNQIIISEATLTVYAPPPQNKETA